MNVATKVTEVITVTKNTQELGEWSPKPKQFQQLMNYPAALNLPNSCPQKNKPWETAKLLQKITNHLYFLMSFSL